MWKLNKRLEWSHRGQVAAVIIVLILHRKFVQNREMELILKGTSEMKLSIEL